MSNLVQHTWDTQDTIFVALDNTIQVASVIPQSLIASSKELGTEKISNKYMFNEIEHCLV